jgi:hypothetical protein
MTAAEVPAARSRKGRGHEPDHRTTIALFEMVP